MKEVAPPLQQSQVHLERYTPWEGEFQDRKRIVLDTIIRGVRHNLSNKWVKVLIGFAWVFSLVFPLLGATFGAISLTQEAGETGSGPEAWEMLDDYDMSFPLTEQIEQNGTAVYTITLMNTGERPDVITVFVSNKIPSNWTVWFSHEGQKEALDHINFSLPEDEMVSFELHVRPPEWLESGEGEVIVEAISRGAENLDFGFDEERFGVSKRIRTITVVGHSEDSPYHFFMGTAQARKDVPSGGELEFELQISNTGLQPDTYIIQVLGLPDDWSEELFDLESQENMSGVFLQPGESRNFTVRYFVPKYPYITNFIAVVAYSLGDPSLSGGVVTMVEVTNIPDQDVTASVLAHPDDSRFSMPILFAILLGAVVGSRAISQDLAQKSFTIYFARPITKLDYLAIKYGSLGATVSLVVLVPVLLVYLGLILLTSVSSSYVISHLWVWGAIFLYSLLIIAVMSSLALSFSALTHKRFYAAFGFVVSYFITGIISGIITGAFNDDRGSVVSVLYSLSRVGAKIFDVSDITYDYSWAYNLLALVLVIVVTNAALAYKIWRTELSE